MSWNACLWVFSQSWRVRWALCSLIPSKDLLFPSTRLCGRSQPWGWGIGLWRKECAECCWWLWAGWGVHRCVISSSLWADFLMETTNPLVGCSEKWLLVSIWWITGPGCCAFRLSSTLSLQIMWYSEWSKKKVSLLGSIPHGWRSWVLTHSLSFRGGIVGHRLSGHWALTPWGRDDPGKVKLFLLPFTMHLFFGFSFSYSGVLELLWGTPTKALSSMGNCQNQCSVEDDDRKLECHLTDVTPIVFVLSKIK